MEKQRKYRTIGIVALVVAVLGLSVAFAALSKTLTINGSARAEASTWDIIWQKIQGQDFVLHGASEVQENYPTVTNSNRNLNLGIITLKEPGDYVTYKVNIKNNGDIDATLQNFVLPSLTGTITGTNHTYSDYITIQVLDATGTTTFATPTNLDANEVVAVVVKVSFNDISNALFNDIPNDGITLSDFEITFNATQASGVAQNSEPVVVSNPVAGSTLLAPTFDSNEDLETALGKSANNFDTTKVKYIEVMNTNEAVANADDSWDASASNNGAVTASYIIDTDGKYKLYIGGDGGVYAPTDSTALFAVFPNLEEARVGYLNTDNVTDMKYMFATLESLTTLTGLNSWDTSSVTSMESMFAGASALTSLNLSSFDTSSVTSMANMFMSDTSLTTINLSGLGGSSLTNMYEMFAGCTSLSTINLTGFTTSNVTNMAELFAGDTSLTSLNLSSFNTSHVTNMSFMFAQCTSLASVNLSSFNTSSVTSMADMFIKCESLTSLNLSNFTTSSVTDMNGMFLGCTSLTSLDLSSFNTSNVTNMAGMFMMTNPDTGDVIPNNLTTLDLSNFTTNLQADISNMFSGCDELEFLNIAKFEPSKSSNNLAWLLYINVDASVIVKNNTEKALFTSYDNRFEKVYTSIEEYNASLNN